MNVDALGSRATSSGMDGPTGIERRLKLRELHKQGLNGVAIAQEMKITKQRVQQLRKAMGLSVISQTKAAEARRALIEPMLRSGVSSETILRKTPGLTPDMLYREAKALGLYEEFRRARAKPQQPGRASADD